MLVSQGHSVAEPVRSIGATQFTYYRSRAELGGLNTDQVERLNVLENVRLRKAVSDVTLENFPFVIGCKSNRSHLEMSPDDRQVLQVNLGFRRNPIEGKRRMPEPRTQRRLAAILAADVVGYSRLMQRDEAGTLAALKMRWRDVLSPEVARHRGRVVKVIGDGVVVEFGSAVDVVECAVALQAGFAGANDGVPDERRILLRIGINLGDVIVEGADLYGDGVNLAARLEGIAEPGGICISANVHDQVRGKLNAGFDDLGPQALKNIASRYKCSASTYRVAWLASQNGQKRSPLPLPDKPSIAVLPFTNMSADPEQEHFVDGMTEDLITDLSRHPALFVIARNSTFAYKGRSLDVRQIARELGVRYLLEGSARRAAGRVRINVQLIDCIGGGHLWAERFDRDMDDIFAMQDEVTLRIVEALIGRLVAAPQRNRPKNIQAYDLCVRGRLLVTGTAGSLEAERESVSSSRPGNRSRSRICRGLSVARLQSLVSLVALWRTKGGSPRACGFLCAAGRRA